MTDKEHAQKQKDKVKKAILKAAKNIVLKDGWQAVSIRKIADAIRYSLPVVYTHFENKEAILEEFVKQGFKALSDLMIEKQALSSKAEDQLLLMANAYFNFALTNTAYYQMMFGLGMPSCERINENEEINEFSKTLMRSIRLLLADDQQEQIILKFHTFWSILHGLTAINMVNATATPTVLQVQVLNDAVQGFIKNTKN